MKITKLVRTDVLNQIWCIFESDLNRVLYNYNVPYSDRNNVHSLYGIQNWLCGISPDR